MTTKTALVTGANGGLGIHVTKALLDAGFTVVGLSPQIQQSDFDHPNFIALPATLTSLDAAKKAVDSVIARSGKIDVLAHLVGGFTGGQTVAEMDDATWQQHVRREPEQRISHPARSDSSHAQGRRRAHHRDRQPRRRRSCAPRSALTARRKQRSYR